METSAQLQTLLMSFVRERDSFSPDDFTTITSDSNIEHSIKYLISVKRDVESQFIASKNRIHDFFAECEEARRNQTDAILITEKFESGTKVKKTEELPPSEAYAKFLAREGRWKVKTVRYLSLIESAITELKLTRSGQLSLDVEELVE